MSDIPLLNDDEFLQRLQSARKPYHESYYAMYSGVTGGIVTNPSLMVVPLDDHMVHRGDAVFETAKFVEGGIYNLDAHLQRLFHSAEQLDIHAPFTLDDVRGRVLETCRAAARKDGLIRILLSRGPGSMGVNPYDCPEPQLYILAYHLPGSFMEQHPEGATACASRYSVKMDFLARVKSCNYLLNALMRKEAADRDVDFVFAYDEAGHLAEGPTETVGIVTASNALHLPLPDRILPGTTMDRVVELAETAREEGVLSDTVRGHVTPEAVVAAREVLIFGTTTDVTAVTRYDGNPVGDGKPGAVCTALRTLLLADIRENPDVRTEI